MMAADPSSAGSSMFDATFWVAAAFFVTLGILAYAKAHRRILAALDARSERIAKQLDEARSLRDEAHAELARRQRRQREAAQEAEDILAQAEQDAQSMLEEADKQLAELTQRREAVAEAKIAHAEQAAIGAVRAEAAAIAIAAARQVIAEQAEGKLGDELIGRTIEQIGGERKAG